MQRKSILPPACTNLFTFYVAYVAVTWFIVYTKFRVDHVDLVDVREACEGNFEV